MNLKMIVKRGQEVNLPALDEGEMAFALDTNIFYIGNPQVSGNIPINKELKYYQFDNTLVRQGTLANLSIDYAAGAGGRYTLTSSGSISFSNLQKGKSYVLQINGDYTLSFPAYCKNIGDQTYTGGQDQFFIVFYCIHDASGSELLIYSINKVN